MAYQRLVWATILGSCSGPLVGTALAQHCESHIGTEDRELVRFRMASGLYESNAVNHLAGISEVRIKWHVLTNARGSVPIDAATLEYYIDRLSEAFAPAGLQFCADAEIDFITDDELYQNVQSTYELRTVNPTDYAIDVYWCPNVQGGQLCGSSSYTFSPVQGIVMQTSCQGESDVSPVLIHEVGHYFDLFHTHEFTWGFDCPNGSECAEVGDLVCDTAPTRNLLGTTCVNPADCSLRVEVADCIAGYPAPLCDGTPYLESETTNYMSYLPLACMIEFTPGQHDRVSATYWNLRPELHDASCAGGQPCAGDLTQDRQVSGEDLSLLLSVWGTADADADLDGSGLVNGGDLAVMLNSWGPCW